MKFTIDLDVYLVRMSNNQVESFTERLTHELEQHMQNFQMTEIDEIQILSVTKIED